MEDGCLTKKALNIIESSQSDIPNWLSTVKLSLKAMSLDNIFSSPSCYSNAYVERMFKAKIRESFIQYWNSELNIADVNSIRNSKLHTYKMFKSKFGVEDYLINLRDFESRKIVVKFRCSDHTHMIETGRHKKIDLEERMCKMCSQKRVEDERPFLLECPTYNRVSKSLLKHVDPSKDDLNNQFIQLMASSNQNVIYDIARYLKRAFKIRNMALGVAALPVLWAFVCVRIGFRQSRVWQISVWCLPIVCRNFGWWGLVSVCICAFWCGWCVCSVVGLGFLGCLLGSLCLVLCGRLCSACWRGLMDDET